MNFSTNEIQDKKFSIDEINEKQLEMLGLTKKDILFFPRRTYENLLDGNRTSLIRFSQINIPGLEGASLDAKLSLKRKDDGSVVLNFHPINSIAKNTFQLSADEIQKLKSGKENFINKSFGNTSYLIALDKITNEYVAANKSKIKAPDELNGVILNERQQADFKEGKDIEILGEKYRFDPNEELKVKEASPNAKISSLKNIKHSPYSASELAIDVALLASGLGAVVMIEHLMNLLYNTKKASKDNSVAQLINENKSFRDALANASPDIAKIIKKGKFIGPQEVKKIIENYLNRPVDIEAMNDIEVESGLPTGLNVIASATENERQEIKSETIKDKIETIVAEGGDVTAKKLNSIAEEANNIRPPKIKFKM